jgi:hypothetical protein
VVDEKKKMPSRIEVFEFMLKEAHPYNFEYVKDIQPLRVSIERKMIYVNADVLMDIIRGLIKSSLDWKEVMRKNLQHEKAHEKFFKWNIKWNVGAAQYGWLASYLTDIVIDRIFYAKDVTYQKWLLADSRHAFASTKKEIWSLFRTIDERPHFLYNQAAYWIAIGAITLDEAASLYAEKAGYIMEMSELFNRIKKEEDLEWAFPQAKMIYFRSFR